MSKTNTSRIHELEERIDVMDTVLADYQEKVRMLTDMMSMMRQHMELVNANLLKLASEKTSAPVPREPVVEEVPHSLQEPAAVASKEASKEASREASKEASKEGGEPTAPPTLMRRIM